MARQPRDGTNAAVILMGMMLGSVLFGPMLVIGTGLSVGLALVLGSAIPAAIGAAFYLRAMRKGNHGLSARLATEVEFQRALNGHAAASARPTRRRRLTSRMATLIALAALTVVIQGAVGGPLSAVLLGVLWVCMIWPAIRSRLLGIMPHGDTQIALVQARSETVLGTRVSAQSAGRSSSGSDKQSRHDQRQVGSSTTRA